MTDIKEIQYQHFLFILVVSHTMSNQYHILDKSFLQHKNKLFFFIFSASSISSITNYRIILWKVFFISNQNLSNNRKLKDDNHKRHKKGIENEFWRSNKEPVSYIFELLRSSFIDQLYFKKQLIYNSTIKRIAFYLIRFICQIILVWNCSQCLWCTIMIEGFTFNRVI